MSDPKVLSTHDKVLELNLDESKYGTFAEIGAGQETANWFFYVGGTAGTIAKTISAYDMTMSDALYGSSQRYVSRTRLESMLDHEYGILVERLGPKRGKDTCFFSFCNTVRARGYQDTGECHGWLGMRIQLEPQSSPGDILLHVRLLDETNIQQQEALGILGVNMIHSAFRHPRDLPKYVASLLDNLSRNRIEVDMLKFSGAPFEDGHDNRLCALQLVHGGLTDAALFAPDGEVMQPAERLYKRPLLVLRGSFNPVTKVNLDMLESAGQALVDDHGEEAVDYIELTEITMHNLLVKEGDATAVDDEDFLRRADTLQDLGKTVLVSRLAEFHRLGAYLSRYTKLPIGVVLGVPLLEEIFQEKWYQNLDGGILEAFGRLFKHKVKLYAYPCFNRKTGALKSAEQIEVASHLDHLFRYLSGNRFIRCLPSNLPAESLKYSAREVHGLIASGDEAAWKPLVPETVIQSTARPAR